MEIAAVSDYHIEVVLPLVLALDFLVRDYVTTFVSQHDALGPWHAIKIDAHEQLRHDDLFLRFVTGNRDDRFSPQHGVFARLEDDHIVTSRLHIKIGVGVGSGYQPIRSEFVEVAAGLDPDRRVVVVGGVTFTAEKENSFQRIYATGCDVHLGVVRGYVRYYAPISTQRSRAGPDTLSLNLALPASRNLVFVPYGNFGGEVGGDRTAAFLPTSSGRYGPDTGMLARAAVGHRASAIIDYQVGVMRNPGGSSAYVAHTVFSGIQFSAGPAKE